MPRGYLSTRTNGRNPLRNLYRNNGRVFWIHYTLHWEGRKRRIRRSLKTSDVATAIARRDELFARLRTEGEEVPERRPRRPRRENAEEARPMLTVLV